MRARFLGSAIALALVASPVWATFPTIFAKASIAEGICAVFEKPAERGFWGDLYGRFFEPLGFRRSVALVIGVSRYTATRTSKPLSMMRRGFAIFSSRRASTSSSP